MILISSDGCAAVAIDTLNRLPSYATHYCPVKKANPMAQDEYLTIAVEDYSASITTSINPEVREPRPENDKVRIFSFGSSIEIKGTCTSPDDG